jgi:hypothetical protein
MTAPTPNPFTRFTLPTGETAWVPADIPLQVPASSSIERSLLHYLIYIPWDDKYLRLIGPDYRDFFRFALPYLRARTTDVHVATCFPFANELMAADPAAADERVVHLAFILHDSGWSQMTEHEIADSLGVEGLALSGAAVAPKARHAELGRDLAQRLVQEYPFQSPLTDAQKTLIYQAIFYHDKPQQLAAMGDLPASLRVVCDVDHLWSFTHENFWQDTLRKGVDPRVYVENLASDLEGYFVTEAGKHKARQLLEARRAEVSAWADWVAPRA